MSTRKRNASVSARTGDSVAPFPSPARKRQASPAPKGKASEQKSRASRAEDDKKSLVRPRPTTFADKAGWLNPTVRELIAATRPWSVPASFIPAAIAVFVVWPRALSLLHCLLPIFAVVFVHLGANSFNTIGDYLSGVDTQATADDRALVDRRVALKNVAIIASLLFLTGGSIALYYALFVISGGHNALYIALAALVLGFFYTTPVPSLSLKHYGLGDTIVGLCFGPLLMCGVASAATGSDVIDPSVVLFSLPIMLLTINILHANNTRDIAADNKVGAVTVASIVATRFRMPRLNYLLYALNLAGAFTLAVVALAYTLTRSYLNAGLPYYETAASSSSGLQAAATTASVVAACLRNADLRALLSAGGSLASFGVCSSPEAVQAMALAVNSSGMSNVAGNVQRHLAAGQHTLRACLFVVVTCLPWAVALCRRFAAGLRGQAPGLKELPQASAQFNLLFGGTVLAGFLPAQAFARALLGLLFYLGGVQNILLFGHTQRLVRWKFVSSGLLPGLSLAGAGVLAAVATCMQLVASVTLMAGYEVKASALVLICFLWPVTGVVHDFWNITDDDNDNHHDIDINRNANGGKSGGGVERVPTFLTAFDKEFVSYFSNALTLGGLAALIAYL